MCDEVKDIRDYYSDLISSLHESKSLGQYLSTFAERLYGAAKADHSSFITFIKNHRVDLNKETYGELKDLFKDRDYLDLSYKIHGFKALVAWDREIRFEPRFEQSVDHLLFSNLKTFKDFVKSNQNLLNARSSFGHRASLAHYAGSNGVEIYRQVVPHDLVLKMKFLKNEMQMNFNLEHNIYGGDCNLRDLIQTSAHPLNAGLAKQLLDVIT